METRKLALISHEGLMVRTRPVLHGVNVLIVNRDGECIVEVFLPIPTLMALVEDAQEFTKRNSPY